MEYISSDTNVWLDFEIIDKLSLPFKLPYIYLMNNDAIEDELLNPPNLSKKLKKLGLKATEITTEEFYLAQDYIYKHKKFSIYDSIALAIAKKRKITLLTGDGLLRKVALEEGVKVIGTLGILDELYENKYIEKKEFKFCIKELLKYNGKKIRLPENELKKRLEK